MVLGMKYIASEGCAFMFDFEEWAILACVVICRSASELAVAVIYP